MGLNPGDGQGRFPRSLVSGLRSLVIEPGDVLWLINVKDRV